MEISSTQFIALISQFLWPFFRVAAMLMSVTVIGTRLVPQKIRLIIAIVVTFAIYQQLPSAPVLDALSLVTIGIIIQQIIIGVAIGFVMQLVFQAFIIGGQLIAMQAGLGFASLIDPQNGVSVPVVSQFYLMLITLLYLSIDGHLIMIEVIANSFTAIPIGTSGLELASIWELLQAGTWMFSGAVVMALPAVVALLVVNIGFAVMTRAAPQLNIFTIGFPITLALGLIILYITLPTVLSQFDNLFSQGLSLTNIILQAKN